MPKKAIQVPPVFLSSPQEYPPGSGTWFRAIGPHASPGEGDYIVERPESFHGCVVVFTKTTTGLKVYGGVVEKVTAQGELQVVTMKHLDHFTSYSGAVVTIPSTKVVLADNFLMQIPKGYKVFGIPCTGVPDMFGLRLVQGSNVYRSGDKLTLTFNRKKVTFLILGFMKLKKGWSVVSLMISPEAPSGLMIPVLTATSLESFKFVQKEVYEVTIQEIDPNTCFRPSEMSKAFNFGSEGLFKALDFGIDSMLVVAKNVTKATIPHKNPPARIIPPPKLPPLNLPNPNLPPLIQRPSKLKRLPIVSTPRIPAARPTPLPPVQTRRSESSEASRFQKSINELRDQVKTAKMSWRASQSSSIRFRLITTTSWKPIRSSTPKRQLGR